ncbi:MAG: hypothetical protein GY794_14095, partial [bacterium]|nr:hypothetical protein [bacterium]
MIQLLAASSMLFVSGIATAADAPANPSLPKWNRETMVRWWAEHKTPQLWKSGKDKIKDVTIAVQRKYGLRRALSSPNFIKWIAHIYWLDVYPDNWLSGHSMEAKLYKRISLEPELPRLFISFLHPEDNKTEALKVLLDLYKSHPAKCAKYPSLAVAFALVWDQKLQKGWPHAYVDKKTITMGKESVSERFDFYVKSFESGKLLLPLRKLHVRDLVFMVDSPLSIPELAFGQTCKIRNPAELSTLYWGVNYDKKRLKQRQAIWKSVPYSLVNIYRKGGICLDRAYMASQTGKAKGVPTILFTGLGVGGVHGWIGH